MNPLWQHQENAVKRFEDYDHCALLWDMGTGKTRTAVEWLRNKIHKTAFTNEFKVLIISPKVTLWNWKSELEPASTTFMVGVVDGTEKKKIEIIKAHPIVVMNPECLNSSKILDTMKNCKFQYLIVDESHRFKNPKSKRLKALLSISDAIPYRMILTGTPILANYLDIWAQWRIMDGGVDLGKNFYVFREKYFRDKNVGFKGRPAYYPMYIVKPESARELSQIMDRKASRIKKEECLSLPDLVFQTESVEMGKEQAKAYSDMEKTLVAAVKAGECTATNALTQVLRMLQILSGYIKTDEETYLFPENPRLDRLKELLEDLTPTSKMIVWSSFQENYFAISALCTSLGIQYAELTGLTKEKAAEIDKFQKDPKVRVIIANPAAGGIGVNLTEASYAVYFSRSFSLGDRLQSEARCYRHGSQKHSKITIIDLIVKDTLDEEVLSALKRKESVSDTILDRLKK